MSPRLIEFFLDATASMDGRRIVALMPLRSDRRLREAHETEALQAGLKHAPVEVWNLTASIPDRCFLSASHLDAEGHALLADELTARLRP